VSGQDGAGSGRVAVSPWHAEHPPYSVGGSVYAVPSPFRPAAAAALAANRCRVHADVILDRAGTHRGVTWSELADIRREVPAARLDLHLIALGEAEQDNLLAEEQRALAAVVELGAVGIAVSPASISRHRDRVKALRGAGHQVWIEVHPARRDPGVASEDVDGALVMFIEPGTTDSADPGQLSKVAELSGRLPVAVDGGITRELAVRCREHGASYLISGRGLLTLTFDRSSAADIASSEKGSHP
jgi:pentose-5-phosphate-3-epimerase